MNNPYQDYQLSVFADGLEFPEGPTVLGDGSLCVAEMRARRITRLHHDGTREVVEEVDGTPNGVVLDEQGRLCYCEAKPREWVVRGWPYDWPGASERLLPGRQIEPSVPPAINRKDGIGEKGYPICGPMADGADVVQPSDIAADPLGNLYFSDAGTGAFGSGGAVWCKPASGERASQIITPLSHPNGVAYDKQTDTLYVAESRTGRLWALAIEEPGHVGTRTCIMAFSGGGPFNLGGADGLAVDDDGFVLVACLGVGLVSVVDPRKAEVVGVLDCGDELLVTNIAVDTERACLYVTLATSGVVLRAERR